MHRHKSRYAPVVWILRRGCKFNYLVCTQLHRLGFKLEFETFFNQSDEWFLVDRREKINLFIYLFYFQFIYRWI